MVYDITTEKLQPFEKQFQYKNTSGGIQATLTNTNSDGKTILSNGAETIPLSVKFNGVELSNTATTVVAKDPAKAGGRTALRITPASDKKLDVAGSFTGNVAMVFEPTLDEQNPPESK